MGLFSRIRNLFRRRRVDPLPNPETHPIEYNGEKISVEIHDTTGFTASELATFKIAIEMMVHVVNSVEFKDRALHPPRKLDHINGLTNEEIYNLFMSGSTALDRTPDKDIDIYITMYYGRTRTIGYTYPDTMRTWVNRKFYGDIGTIVGNLVHEYMHKCGFDHESSGYTQYNVPYYYGNIAEYLTQKMLNGQELTPIKTIDKEKMPNCS